MVLQADRSLIGRRTTEPTGEAESLWGKLGAKSFGDRARPDDSRKKKEAVPKSSGDKKKKNERYTLVSSSAKISTAFSNILNATENFEDLDYQPKTKQTRETYELILGFLAK